jgi:hypothetical protein
MKTAVNSYLYTYSYAECTCLQTKWLTQIFPTMNLTLTAYLEDNCIVFENFTASIGDLMVANRVYYPLVSCPKGQVKKNANVEACGKHL